jgi:hypothetical protein
MKIPIDLAKCRRNNITPDQYVILYLLYLKEYEAIKNIFGVKGAVFVRDSLCNSKYILSKHGEKFTETVISKPNVTKLCGIRADKLKFVEFYLEYPIKVGSRILRAANVDTVLGRKHERKYFLKVTTEKAHKEAVKAIKVFVEKQKQAGRLQYLPNIETVLNNAMWENWLSLIDESGKEQKDWNEESI